MKRRVGLVVVVALVAFAAVAATGCSQDSGGGNGSNGGTCGGGGSGSGGVVAGDPTGGVGGEPVGCVEDATVPCSGGAYGFSCPTGINPENYGNVVCSNPTATDGCMDAFCCFPETSPGLGSGTCSPDDAISCPWNGYGFACAAGDDPATYDANLTCSVPTPDGASEDFCCQYSGGSSGSVPTGCTAEATITCSGSGAQGYACAAGDDPENYDDLVCSDPTADADGVSDDFCCFSGGSDFSATTCNPDDRIGGFCAAGSYGFQCVQGDDPQTYDASLDCSTSQPDADGVHDDYCCTY